MMGVREPLCNCRRRHGTYFCENQHTDGVLTNGIDHTIEHFKAFDTILNHRIMLPITAQ